MLQKIRHHSSSLGCSQQIYLCYIYVLLAHVYFCVYLVLTKRYWQTGMCFVCEVCPDSSVCVSHRHIETAVKFHLLLLSLLKERRRHDKGVEIKRTLGWIFTPGDSPTQMVVYSPSEGWNLWLGMPMLSSRWARDKYDIDGVSPAVVNPRRPFCPQCVSVL